MADRRARVTVWWPKKPLTGSWGEESLMIWVQQLYEYFHGVPATIERKVLP